MGMGPKSNITDVLIKRRNLDTDGTHKEWHVRMKRDWSDASIAKAWQQLLPLFQKLGERSGTRFFP
jgi:hypothetical protein